MRPLALICILAAIWLGVSPRGPAASAGSRPVVGEGHWRPLGYHLPPRATYGVGATGELELPPDAALPSAVREAVRVWGAGRELRADVWRENKRFGAPPTSLGSLDLVREVGGGWRVRSRTPGREPDGWNARWPWEAYLEEHLELELPAPEPR